MAHSFDVFYTAGTHAYSCQSNGGLASNFSKMHRKIDMGSTKSCIFIILIYFSLVLTALFGTHANRYTLLYITSTN